MGVNGFMKNWDHYIENPGKKFVLPRFIQIRYSIGNPKVNIIFVTICSESEHAKDVMRLKPSGYLTKEATSEQILEELQNLRYPVA